MAYLIGICIFTTCVLPQTLAEKSPYWEYTSKLCNWSKIVPDILEGVPDDLELCQVLYPSGAEVLLGNYLNRTQAHDPPLLVSWPSDPSAHYVMILEDADLPIRENEPLVEIILWMVGNIPGNDVSAGETIIAYTLPQGSFGTGIRRYIFLIYKQPEKIDFIRELNIAEADRGSIQVKAMQQRYRWEGPVAINFFYHRYNM